MIRRFGNRAATRLLSIVVVCVCGLIIAFTIGILQNSGPFGDDSIYYVGEIKSLASSFPFLGWDPHSFTGYTPTLGLSWVTYGPPTTLALVGVDPVTAFHVFFILVFLGMGLSVYYFARSVGSIRSVAVSVAILAWSTNAYWNTTIWGGAYNRGFTVPIMILALASAYRFVSAAKTQSIKANYWISVSTWTLTLLGDIFVAVAGASLALIFLVLSGGWKDIRLGIKRAAVVLGPPVGLTSWHIWPLINQTLVLGSYRSQYTVPNPWSWLLVPGQMWAPTLNWVNIPLTLILALACVMIKARFSPPQKALVVSVTLMGLYWFVMGWVPALWAFIPRLMATNSSVENLTWICLISIPLLFSVLWKSLERFAESISRPKLPFLLGIASQKQKLLGALVLVVVGANALVVVPTIRPVDWGFLNQQLNLGINSNSGPPSSDFRVSLENRYLSRSFSFYQPARFNTGGRVETLNPNPVFSNWYLTDVFYKNDLPYMGSVYIDDRPIGNFSALLESSPNFAGPNFWLDWYGVNRAVFFPYYAAYNTINNYTIRPSLFSVTRGPTTASIPEIFVRPNQSSGVLVATNATVVGFYSDSNQSLVEYESLIAMLADLGLDSRFVVPLYFQTLNDALMAPLNSLLTDSYTYGRHAGQFQNLSSSTNVVVVSSIDETVGTQPTLQMNGKEQLVKIPVSFSQLLGMGETGAYDFVKSTSIVQIESINATASTYVVPSTVTLTPTQWAQTYKTSNAQGNLETGPSLLTVNVTNTDPSQRAQFNIDYLLPQLVPVSGGAINLSVKTSANLDLGISFSSTAPCCPNYVGINQKVSSLGWTDLQIPFSSLTSWGNYTSMFGFSRDLTLAINLPAGSPGITVQLSNVTVASPGYTVSKLQKSVSLTDVGALIESSGQFTGLAMANGTNASTAILSNVGGGSTNVVTISSLLGGISDQEYDQIISVGASQPTTASLVRFVVQPWQTIHQQWTTSQDMNASSIPKGFRGIVWKETYSPLWRFKSQVGQPLPYYYAGPGMMYLAPADQTSSLSSTYYTIDVMLVSAVTIGIATLVILALFTRRFIEASTRVTTQSTQSDNPQDGQRKHDGQPGTC